MVTPESLAMLNVGEDRQASSMHSIRIKPLTVQKPHLGLLILLLAAICGGCSVKRMAVDYLGNALAEGGSVYAKDNDPQLVREALPFSLKLLETLLAESPENSNLLLAATAGFTQYAYAFIQQDADREELEDIDASDRMRFRARNLFLRAKQYGMRGLDARHGNFTSRLMQDPATAVKSCGEDEVGLLFWTAVAWAGAINVSRDEPELIAQLPLVDALIDRAHEVDPYHGQGAIESFLISYEFARAISREEAIRRSREHFRRAVQISRGQQASPYVSLAESVAVTEQNRDEFVDLLEQALAIDPDAEPENRLANLIAQERARWLLTQTDELFWNADKN